MHIILEIDIRKTKETVKDQQKIEKIWRNKIVIVVDEMSIVSLDLLVTVDLHLGKAKALHKNSSAVLSELSIIIFFGDFFQFFPVTKRSLWEVTLNLDKEYR